MNSKKKPVIKPVSTKPKILPAKVARPPSLPEPHRNDAPGNSVEVGKKSNIRGKTSYSARPAPKHLPIMPTLTKVEYFKDIVATIREPLLVLDAGLRVLAANRSFYKFFKVKVGETIGQPIYDLGNRQWDIPGLRTLLETILPDKAVFNDYEVEHNFPFIGKRSLLLNARRIPAPPKEAQWILLAFEDVTERMELERKLQASEQRFRRAFDTAQDGMLLIEKKGGQILNSNQSAENMLDYSKRTLRKKNLWDLGILKDEGQFKQISLDLEERGVVDLVDKSIPTRGGENIPADVYLMDRAAVIQCNIRDIKARKQSEGAIHDLARFPTENPNPVMRIDRGGNLVYANEAALVQVADWKLELGKPAPRVLNDVIREVFTTGAAKTVETTCGERIFTLSIHPTPTQKDVNVYGIDITERKLAEEALIYERNLLNALMDNIPDHIYFKDIDSRFIRMNRAQADRFGISNPVQAMGKTDFDYFTEQHARPAFENEQEIIKTGRPMVNFEEAETYRDGRVATVSTTKIPFRNPDGQIIGTIGISRDITERKQAEGKLKEYSEHLEEMVEDRTRDLRNAQEQLVRKEKLAVLGQLAGSMGHELRNPLGVISNSVYYLKLVQPDVNEKIKQHHAMIEQEVHNAAQIVGDLLDYARVISTNQKSLSMPELVEHTLSRFPVPVSIPVSLEIPADLPQVYADPLHVEQILGNLITNACQAMKDSGKLTISASMKKRMATISVKDTGSGITPENMQKLFEPLFSTKVTGIGLGLAVSKKLAEANAGRIEVESEVGKGSIFTVYLPVNEGS